MNALFMLYPVVLIILLFWGADFSGLVRPSKCNNSFAAHDDFFVQSKIIKAGACLFIILHHLVQKTTIYGNIDKGPINIFNDMGYMLTAVFFFFSGYGLLISFLSKPDYLDSFLIKRLPSVLLPFWLINIIYMLLNRFVYGKREGIIEILKDFFGLQTVNGNGWFIIEITVIYLLFFVIFRLVKNRDAALTILSITVLVIVPFVLTRGHKADGAKELWFQGEWWGNSTVTFILGMLYARFKDNWDAFFKKLYYPKLIITAVLAVLMHIVAVVVNWSMGYYHAGMPTAVRDAIVTIIVQNIDACIFVMFILLLSMKISLGNRFIKFISGVSLELYLIHGAVLELVFFKIDAEDVVLFAIVYVASIIVTALLAPIISTLVKRAIAFLQFFTSDKRNRKKVALGLVAVVLVFLAVVGGLLYGERFFFAEQTYEEEMKMLRNAGVGTHVQWGRYDTNPLIPGAERLTWTVVSKKSGVACLLATEGIDGSYYNQKHESVTWQESDLHDYMNSGHYMKMFNKFELQRVEAGPDGDYFSLLTAAEAEEFFDSDEDRELTITAVAKNRGTNVNTMSKVHSWDMKEYRTSWWWLRGDDEVSALTAPIVNEDGAIELDKKYVNKPSGAIRPIIYVRYGI